MLMTFGSMLVPLPSEISLPFTGFLVSKGVFSFPLVVFVAATGDVVGSVVLYGIGFYLEETLIINLFKKHGKYLLLTERDYHKASGWFNRYGDKIIFFGKLLPGPRYIISLPAGAVKMDLKKFLLYSFLGSLVWCSSMTYIGVYFGNQWDTLGPVLGKFRLLLIGFFVLLLLLYINHKAKLLKNLNLRHFSFRFDKKIADNKKGNNRRNKIRDMKPKTVQKHNQTKK